MSLSSQIFEMVHIVIIICVNVTQDYPTQN